MVEGKCVIITSNSSVFLKLTKYFIIKSKRDRSEFFVISEQVISNQILIKKRIQKIGLLGTLDEWIFSNYEKLFNHWKKAEKKHLSNINLNDFEPDLIVESINCKKLFDAIINYNANNLLSIGSGYINNNILKIFETKFNIHPGILPNYKGIGTPEAMMNFDFNKLGWTIHELAPKIDSGNIIRQKFISKNDFKNMNFADIYLYLYQDCITDFFEKYIQNSSLANDLNTQYQSRIRMSKYFKYCISKYLS